jgi:serine/threonine protein phosphatase PrpC
VPLHQNRAPRRALFLMRQDQTSHAGDAPPLVTRDHSLVQKLFDAGALSAAEAAHHPSAHIITRAVGAENLELDKVTDRLLPGDRFLLCGDGLFKTVPEPSLAEILASDQDDTANRMLAEALARRADDNVTAVAVEVLGEAGALQWRWLIGDRPSAAEILAFCRRPRQNNSQRADCSSLLPAQNAGCLAPARGRSD